MFRTYANTYQLISLLDNGAFEYRGEKLHFWRIDGAGEDVRGNTYEVIELDSGLAALELDLSESSTVSLYQSFNEDTIGTMDFSRPLAHGQRASLAHGYEIKERKVLAHHTEFTLAFDVYMKSGKAEITLYISALDGATAGTLTQELPITITASKAEWIRYCFKFSYSQPIGRVGINVKRIETLDHTVVQLSKFSLFNGSYDVAPYTGDVMARALPKGAILLWMGSICPDGFEELGEGDLTPKDSWAEWEPDIKARKGNYPRAAEVAGEVQHTRDKVTFRVGNVDNNEFEGFDSKYIITNSTIVGTTQPAIDLSASNGEVDVPDDNGIPTHTHTIEPADTRPASFGLLFCQRL